MSACSGKRNGRFRKRAATLVDVDRASRTVDHLNMAPHLTLQEWWSRTEAGITTGREPEGDISELEARYSVVLPTDFRQYLAESSPTAENWDTENGNWWPFWQIKNIPDEYEHAVAEPIATHASKHLFFLDHMQWCWAWAISCVDDESFGRVALICGHQEAYVASSFTDFVSRYTTDWADVSRLSQARPVRSGLLDRLLRR